MKHLRAALDAAFAVAVVFGCVALAATVTWQLAVIVGGLLGLIAVAASERRSR